MSDDDLLIMIAELHVHGMQLNVIDDMSLGLKGDPDRVPMGLLVEVGHERARLISFMNTAAKGDAHDE